MHKPIRFQPVRDGPRKAPLYMPLADDPVDSFEVIPPRDEGFCTLATNSQLATLNVKGRESTIRNEEMKDSKIDTRLLNFIRSHRRRVGLSQRELGKVLGYGNAETVARHERLEATPPLQIAIRYELIFHVPVSELFAGVRDEVAADIEEKLTELEVELGQRSARDRNALTTARKLVWLSEWRNTPYESVQ
jgi:DNA-binding XRE family transcriptional regulator